jgi:DNA ligase 4
LSAPGDIPGWMFAGLVVHFDPEKRSQPNGVNDQLGYDELGRELQQREEAASWTLRFGGGLLSEELDNMQLTHVVVHENSNVKQLRRTLASRPRLPRIVTRQWIEESWKEQTLLDEERFAPS